MVTDALIPMTTGIRRMTTTTDILTLSQLLSPTFPVGAFAYSHGLETAISDGAITSAATLEAWLINLIEHGGGRTDGVFLNLAYDPAADLSQIDGTARAFSPSAERLRETDLQGAAFCDTVREVWGLELHQLCYPVAVGRTAQLLSLDVELTTALYLQAFVGNLCAAAMRLVPLGQISGQRTQNALKPYCRAQAKAVGGATLDDIHSCSWASDIAAMRHETQYSRIFRT